MNRTSRLKLSFVLLPLLLTVNSGLALAQAQGGVIQGIVTSESGEPIEAATIYLTSPALLGIEIVFSGKTGFFDIPGLSPGLYTLTAEKPGFKTVISEPLELRAGMTAFVRLKLFPAEREGETTVGKISPAGDLTASQKVTILERGLLERLPLDRDFSSILKVAPGTFSTESEYSGDSFFLGSSWRHSFYRLDGVNITDDFSLTPLAHLDSAIIEELEVVTAGQPLSQIPAGGTHVNIISRSGGNTASGELGLFFINDSWNKDLWSSAQVEQMGVTPPGGVKNHFEPLFNLGGRFWTDRAWFFLSSRFLKMSREDVFLAPFQDVHGRSHSGYDWTRQDISTFFKLTVKPIANAQVMAWVNLTDSRQPVAEEPSAGLPYLSTHLLDNDNSFALHAAGHYFLGQNTLVSASASYLRRTALSLIQEEARDLPWSDDAGDRYGPLSGADYNSEIKREQLQGEATARRFIPYFAGMRHTLSAGFSYLQTISYVDWWRENNLLWYLDSRRAHNDFYPGEGLVGFWLCGAAKSSTVVRGQTQRLGGYIADTVNIGRRLTFSLSLRLDHVSAGFTGAAKSVSGNPLSYFVGQAFIKPYSQAAYPDLFPNGINPWANLGFGDRGDFLSYLALSPRLGAVVNLWGEGKTLLKATYARYADDLTPRDLLPLHPLYPGNISFFWLDANGDGRPDNEDEFSLLSFDLRSLAGSFLKKRAAADLSAPAIEEISFGLEQFVGKYFSFSLRFISRHQKNIPADVLYDLDSGKTWYKAEETGTQKHWIPFTTTIPANGDFPAQTVTFYARSKQAPPVFRQWRNVPELERKYRAFELSLEKKMAQGWQFAGMLILSRTEGNVNGLAEPITGLEARVIDPNYFLNRYGRLDVDRPILLKLQGSAKLPLGFLLSAFYQYQSGRPWQRQGRILPPADWGAANGAERIYYAVYLEPAGSRREESWSSLDGRLEKEWKLGDRSRLSLALDVLNVLGAKRAVLGLNDVDIWEPAVEGAGKSGRLILSPDYQKTRALQGKRVLRFSLRLAF